MKKKLVGSILVISLLSAMLGCGETNEGSTVQKAVTDNTEIVNVKQEEIREEKAKEELKENNTEPSLKVESLEKTVLAKDNNAVEMKNIVVHEQGYEGISYLNKDLLMAMEDGKWWLKYADTGENVGSELLGDKENGWDIYCNHMDNGCFAVSKKQSDGKYEASLYYLDDGLTKVYGAINSEAYFKDYRDGIIYFENEEFFGYYFLEGAKNTVAYKKDSTRYTGINRGQIVVNYNTYVTGLGECWTYDVSTLMMNPGNIDGKNFEQSYKVDGKDIIFMNNVPNKDGWLSSAAITIYEENGQLTFGNDLVQGFFNCFTNEFVEIPKGLDLQSTTYLYDENGNSMTTVQGDLAVLNIGKDENIYKEIFDLTTGKIATDKKYKYIGNGFKLKKNVKVVSSEGKHGYIDGYTLKESGEWYEDATDFCNGYALVKKDDLFYLIDEAFNICSEGIKMDAADAVKDYLIYNNLEGEPVFYAKLDGLWHMVTIK